MCSPMIERRASFEAALSALQLVAIPCAGAHRQRSATSGARAARGRTAPPTIAPATAPPLSALLVSPRASCARVHVYATRRSSLGAHPTHSRPSLATCPRAAQRQAAKPATMRADDENHFDELKEGLVKQIRWGLGSFHTFTFSRTLFTLGFVSLATMSPVTAYDSSSRLITRCIHVVGDIVTFRQWWCEA